MNFKEMFPVLFFALLITFVFQYFFAPKPVDISPEPKAGREFSAPQTALTTQPLNLSFAISATSITRQQQVTEVATPHARYSFSNNGGVLESIVIKRPGENAVKDLTTVTPSPLNEKKLFAVVLQDGSLTPWQYDLVQNTSDDVKSVIVYRGATDRVIVTKEFTIHHDNYVIDLNLTVAPRGGELALQPRIFFTNPWIVDELNPDDLKALVYTEKGSLDKKNIKNVDLKGWQLPELFGTADRFFIHACIKDNEKFARRAYYKSLGDSSLISILEGPEIKDETVWHMSYYCGPQELKVLASVDARLESVLDYGMFAFFARPMLKFLIFLYGYVHNYGWAILLLTLLLRLLMLPLTIRAERSQRINAEGQRKLKYIEHRYKDDPEQLAAAREEHTKKHGLSMLSGCLPLLLQLPVFVALQRILSSSIDLYQAPFVWWIKDLSAKDPLYILPLLFVLGNISQAANQKDAPSNLTSVLMALVMGALMAQLSAGVMLFITASTLLGVAQSRIQKALGY